jgi:hypothetical protein
MLKALSAKGAWRQMQGTQVVFIVIGPVPQSTLDTSVKLRLLGRLFQTENMRYQVFELASQLASL